MRIGVIIPDRGDRSEFKKNCTRLIERQEFKPVWYSFIDYPAKSAICDITQRYRFGYENYGGDVDLIAFMENDDWYASDYLEYMANEWEKAGRPDLFGTNYTIYYHLKKKAYFTMRHIDRASAMNTFVKPGLKIDWCPDHEPYTDIHLWMKVEGITKQIIEPSHIISVGMKHGMTMTGGRSHVDRLHRYINTDHDLHWLKDTVDEESFKFYKSLTSKLNEG